MKWHSIFWRLPLVIGLTILAWLVWQSPVPAQQPAIVRLSLPVTPVFVPGQAEKLTQAARPLWRVVTHRMISPEGIKALRKRLAAMQLQTISIHTTEMMTMYAFDDAVLFKSSRRVRAMAQFWQQHDIETNIIKAAKGVYLLGLGRYFQAKYAEELQKQLDHVGRKYRYQQRRVPIPVVRFTFPPANRRKTETLWKKLNITGVVMPVLMSESQFDKLYANSMHASPAIQQPDIHGM